MLNNVRIQWGLLGLGGLVAVALMFAMPQPAQAQTLDPNLLHACYIPEVGAVYRVGTDDTPAGCFETTHVLFSWNPMELGCTDGQVAKWIGTGWACGEDETGVGGDHTHTGAEIADNSLTAADLAANSVGASEIATGAVGATEIATDAVGAAEIQAGAVGASEIATDAVGTTELRNAR